MILDCPRIAAAFDAEIKSAVSRLRDNGVVPRMCEVLATQAQSALSYSATKKRKAEALGIEYEALHFEQDAHLEDVLAKLDELNNDSRVHGILVGMPSYSHIDSERLISAIVPHKDVDGLGPLNSYYVYSNQEHLGIAPATGVAAVHILETQMSLRGKAVTVLGRGRTVGRPVASMLINRDATVSICHSRTPIPAMEAVVRSSEVIVAAMGVPGVVRSEWFRPGQTVVDCGIAFADGKTVGDVNAAEVSEFGAVVTPVPKGVGIVTNSMIFGNLLRATNLGLQHE